MTSLVAAILVLAGAVGIGAGQIASRGEVSIAVGIGALAFALRFSSWPGWTRVVLIAVVNHPEVSLASTATRK